MAMFNGMIYLAPQLINSPEDLFGDTPLMYAICLSVESEGDTEVIEWLLLAGVLPLVTNKHGSGVLHELAKDLGTPALRHLFRDLVHRGADVNGRNLQGQTPLFKFAERHPQDSDEWHNPDNHKRKIWGDLYEEPREKGAIVLL